MNSANAVNSTSATAITPGINPVFMDADDAPDQVTQANFTIEQPMKGNSALRVSWNFSHDANLWNYYYFNNHPSALRLGDANRHYPAKRRRVDDRDQSVRRHRDGALRQDHLGRQPPC